ncbi:MAG: potassium transporter TrkA [Desulfurococcales archaeon ex4484_58]|nr:MAG: potassium transporter TrkA [Desulfurococcales archaeon ex4484_58]
MRIMIAGGGETGAELAKALINEKHEVILIERDRSRVDDLAEKLDCLVIHGDATNPRVLEEAGIKDVDIVIAVTGNDHDNIIVSLIARSMKVDRVIVKVNDPSYNDLLLYAGINEIVNPSRLVIDQILSLIRGLGILNISNIMRSGIRFVTIRVPRSLAGAKISDLKIDEQKARILLIYKGDNAFFVEENTVLDEDDELLIAVKPSYIDKIQRIFQV